MRWGNREESSWEESNLHDGALFARKSIRDTRQAVVRQTGLHADRQMEKTDGRTDKQAGRQAGRQARRAGRQVDCGRRSRANQVPVYYFWPTNYASASPSWYYVSDIPESFPEYLTRSRLNVCYSNRVEIHLIAPEDQELSKPSPTCSAFAVSFFRSSISYLSRHHFRVRIQTGITIVNHLITFPNTHRLFRTSVRHEIVWSLYMICYMIALLNFMFFFKCITIFIFPCIRRVNIASFLKSFYDFRQTDLKIIPL